MEDKTGHSRSKFRDVLEIVLLALVIMLPIRFFLAQSFVVHGASMEPNFHHGEYLIIDKISYRFQEPQRGDVIVFRYPRDPSQHYIKRIIGLPGDTVEIEDGIITITTPDGINYTMDESGYLASSVVTGSDGTWTNNEGVYFVMGDNRGQSYDSRHWGTLPKKLIAGRVLIRVFPVNKMNFFPSQAEPQLTGG